VAVVAFFLGLGEEAAFAFSAATGRFFFESAVRRLPPAGVAVFFLRADVGLGEADLAVVFLLREAVALVDALFFDFATRLVPLHSDPLP